MNCGEWEEKIALYVGGELTGSAAADVERHLGQCLGCQVFASGMQQSLEWMKSAHLEIPAEAHFAAVRARVLAELGRRKERRIWWAAVAGAVAFAAILLMMLNMRTPRTPSPQTTVVAGVPAPVARPTVEIQPPARPHIRHVAGSRRRPGPKPLPRIEAEPARPLVVKLMTEDPNVVIYWITDTRGGE